MRIAAAVAISLAMIAAAFSILIRPGSGPTYQGRNAREWIHIRSRGYSGHANHATNEEVDAAEAAIRAMGTNVVPFAVKLITNTYPPFLKSFHDNDAGVGYEVLR